MINWLVENFKNQPAALKNVSDPGILNADRP